MSYLRLHCRAAASCAEKLVSELGLTNLPIDPFEIARRHDIAIKPKPSNTPGVSGFLMKVGDTFGIMYATHLENEGFQRFTIAHELGHYFLPGHPDKLFPYGDGIHESKGGFISRDPIEEEADHFAASLLMPQRLFIVALESAGEGFTAIEHMSSLCVTSLTSTAIRYANFSPDPVAVILSVGSKIDFCFMSDVMRDIPGITWIRKGDLVPPSSATHRFNLDRDNIRLSRRDEAWTSMGPWFDGDPEMELKEDVVGLGSYGKTLTVLFTDEIIDDE